ncbi:hypothetical protein [Haloarcula litorea]|uniref:hypothetical protein n=1 Tax=Haloarcula litorea TaxID=3032579 RepID=UPI0023E8431E|nr:hypothetical protein [Halomicroarcula sp. GDY20]
MSDGTDPEADGEREGDPPDGDATDEESGEPVAASVVGDEAVTEADEETDAPDTPTERQREFAKMQRRLDEREMGLDSRSEELDQRERNLDQREQRLDERERELEDRRDALDEREVTLRQRAETLDERATEIEEQEEQLAERAAKLGDHEETLHTYIDGQVEGLTERVTETMHDALDEHEHRTGGQFGPAGTILVGLVGLALSVVGVGYVVLAAAGSPAVVFGGTVTNLVAGTIVLLIGLALNLGPVAGRV